MDDSLIDRETFDINEVFLWEENGTSGVLTQAACSSLTW